MNDLSEDSLDAARKAVTGWGVTIPDRMLVAGIAAYVDAEQAPQLTLTPAGPEAMLVERLRDEAADEISRLTRERDEAQALSDRLKLEAQIHAGEAQTANSTIYEIYQVLSGSKGEPGNWHGAEPARQFVETAEAQIERLTSALLWAMDEIDVLSNKHTEFAYPQGMALVGRSDQLDSYRKAVDARRAALSSTDQKK